MPPVTAVENRRRVAYDADMDWAMMSGFVALAALMAGLYRDAGRRIDDMRAENREAHANLRAESRDAHAQTGKRIDDLRATVVALVPRAAAEPVAER